MKDVKLYNVLFPVWFLLMIPVTWLVVLPGNFLIDSLVLVIFMYRAKMEQKKHFYKRHILQVFCFGLLSDVVGAVFMFLCAYVLEWGIYGDELYLTIPAAAIAGGCIFLLNYFITFRKVEAPRRRNLALTFAIATAPYTFLIPSSWVYGF